MDDGSSRLQELLRDGLAMPMQSLAGEPPMWFVVAEHLAREVGATAKRDSRGVIYSPDQFTLSLHTVDARTLAGNSPNVQDELARVIQAGLAQAGFSFVRYPHVTLSSDPTLKMGEARVIAWHSRDPLSLSTEAGVPEEPLTPPAVGAFLIVDGSDTSAWIAAGHHWAEARQPPGAPDPHVSRRHRVSSQAGWASHVARSQFDLGARVNGSLIDEHLLQAGDVITISGSP
jgi:hypothetical protein